MNNHSLDDIVTAYSRFVPHQFLKLLGKDSVVDITLGESLEKKMTILFSDMRDFTTLSESMTPRQNFEFINAYLERMEPVITRHNGVIDKYIGDAIMAFFPTSPDDALECAIEMLDRLAGYNEERGKVGHRPVSIGIGLNTGLMMLGTVGGRNRIQSTVISDAVNLASRVETMTKSYGTSLLITEQTYYGLRDPSRYAIRFADRVMVKGKTQPQSVYEVFDGDPPATRNAKRRTARLFEGGWPITIFGRFPAHSNCSGNAWLNVLGTVWPEFTRIDVRGTWRRVGTKEWARSILPSNGQRISR